MIQNSQCSAQLVSAVGSGNTFTLTLNMTFAPGFGGNRITYIAGRDQAGYNSDWQALGDLADAFHGGADCDVGWSISRPRIRVCRNRQSEFSLSTLKN